MNKQLFSEENPVLEMANHYIAGHLGVDPESERELKDKIDAYSHFQNDLIKQYLKAADDQHLLKNNALHFLNSWIKPTFDSKNSSQELAKLVLTKSMNSIASGFYLRWNDVGVVVNPGCGFLDNFHKEGYFLKDIQHVIITNNHPKAYEDVFKIYSLNYQLNKLNPDLHVINYYMSQPAYQALSHLLKPNFKQERHMLHSLELFLDSSEVENEQLAEGLSLQYFTASSRGQADCLGIKFNLKPNYTSTHNERTIGYLSNTAWSPLLTHHLDSCDVIIAGFGKTNPNDYGKLNYSDDCLGYFGTFSLVEAIKPHIFLCTEFNASDGDIRLEVIKKLRKESVNNTTLLPTDNGLVVDVDNLTLQCSDQAVPPQDVKIVPSNNPFGCLQYVSAKMLF